MKRTWMKLTALTMAMCLLLGLTACGGGDNTQQLSATVFVPTFQDVDLDVDYIDYVCFTDSYVFLIGTVSHEVEETVVEPETGEEYTQYNYENETLLYRMDLDGGNVVKLDNYQMTEVESEDMWSYINSFVAGEDDTIYLSEYISGNIFNLPEDFDPETDDRWNYAEYQETVIRRHLDKDGNELDRTEETSDGSGQSDLAAQLGVDWLNSYFQDSQGHTYASTDTFVVVLDSEGNELFRLNGENLWGSMYELADGSVAMNITTYDQETETSTSCLRVIDTENQSWGTEYSLPISSYRIYTGKGDYLFYYRVNDAIYGVKNGETEGRRLFSWIEADINSSEVQDFTFLPDGRVEAVTNTWIDDGYQVQLVTMTETPREELPEKTTLIYGTMYLDYEMRSKIIEFNKSSATHRIEVRDYSEYNTGEDNSGGLTRLNTEMIAGNVPDILDVSNLPIRQYGARGLLEDLWPWIEQDPEIGRESLVEPVFNAASQDGKLYYIFDEYSIQTVVGDSNIVGDRMSWTVADLQEALAKMPAGCAIFSNYDIKTDMLRTVLAQNLDSFVDWKTGECSFDSDGFKNLLEFCNSFPDDYPESTDDDMVAWESDYARLMNGKQLLTTVGLSNLEWQLRELATVFDGHYSYIGYPKEDGSVGSSFYIYGGVAMSAACKDKEAVWNFIRDILLPEEEDEGYYYYYYSMSVNKADFEKMLDYSMREYELDENGDPLLDEEGNPIPVQMGSVYVDDSTQLEMKPLTEADREKFMALVNSITTVNNYDERIYDIVKDIAGGYFAGDTPLDSAATQIQSRVKLYVNEQR